MTDNRVTMKKGQPPFTTGAKLTWSTMRRRGQVPRLSKFNYVNGTLVLTLSIYLFLPLFVQDRVWANVAISLDCIVTMSDRLLGREERPQQVTPSEQQEAAEDSNVQSKTGSG